MSKETNEYLPHGLMHRMCYTPFDVAQITSYVAVISGTPEKSLKNVVVPQALLPLTNLERAIFSASKELEKMKWILTSIT